MGKLLGWYGHRWIALAFRLYLGSVFLFASYHKLLHPESFALDIATYQLLPVWAVNAFALVVPWIEAAVGILLVVGVRTQASSLLVGMMMGAFMIALGWALHLHLDMSCGCFASQGAVADDPISWRTLVRDSIWLLQAAYVFVLDRQPIGIEPWIMRALARRA